MDFENSVLWKNALARRAKDVSEQERERLRALYLKCRANAKAIGDTIRDGCPGLTLHTVEHLDAIWDAADLVAGDDFELNPLEAFCFGAAILIHDAGHSIAVYPGGLRELKKSHSWRDSAVAALGEPYYETKDSEGLISNLPPEIEKRVLFDTLRRIHASVAERLACLAVEQKKTNQKLHLIEDDQIRLHYGPVIGLIAASHHWPLDELSARLPEQIGALAGFPRNWIVDPLKLACLLRCADAVQIDQRRAPDFLFALLSLEGVSVDHWFAQNRLAQPLRDRQNSDIVVFTSTAPFPPSTAHAWWIAYELVQVADRELAQTHMLLIEKRKQPFLSRAVAGARSPESLARFVQTDGWTPVDARIRVSDAARLAGTLGGRQLYGDNPTIVLRELIQNAADAVRARRTLQKEDRTYKGRVTLRSHKMAEGYRITIEDNGIGMSERVLTLTLMDFGSSLWSNDLVEREFPGLRSSTFRPTGKFGIGFFSVFMIAENIEVTSRRYDASHEDGHLLKFEKGLALRPILSIADKSIFSSGSCTLISFTINVETYGRLLSYNRAPQSFSQVVGRLCPMVDSDIWVSDSDNDELLVHSEKWFEEAAARWLERIYTGRPVPGLASAASRTTLLIHDGAIVGRGALPAQPNTPREVRAVGGFEADEGRGLLRTGSSFVGSFECSPASARREGGEPIADATDFMNWAKEQIQLAIKMHLPIAERAHLGATAAELGLFSSELFYLKYRHPGGRLPYYKRVDELANDIKLGTCLIFHLGEHSADAGWPMSIKAYSWTPNELVEQLESAQIDFERVIIGLPQSAEISLTLFGTSLDDDDISFDHIGEDYRTTVDTRTQIGALNKALTSLRVACEMRELRENAVTGDGFYYGLAIYSPRIPTRAGIKT